MRLPVVGDQGYIGVVLVPVPRAAGHEVDGLGLCLYDGCDELVAACTDHGLAFDDFTSSRFGRLRRIRGLLSAGLLDEMLHRPTGALFPPSAAVTAPGRG
jgi:hypothetical protein